MDFDLVDSLKDDLIEAERCYALAVLDNRTDAEGYLLRIAKLDRQLDELLNI